MRDVTVSFRSPTADGPCRLWFLVVLSRKGSDPVEHCLSRDPQQSADPVHGDPTQIPEQRRGLRAQRLASWDQASKLIATVFAQRLRLASGRTVFDDVITLAF
jgi:hypothetical protein